MVPALAPPAIALGLGLTANAYFFFGNFALSQLGPLPMISKPDMRERFQFSLAKSSEVFDFFYHSAAIRFVASTSLASLSYLTSATLQSGRTDPASKLTTRLLYLSAALTVLPIPWTLVFMLPVNNVLIAKSKQSQEGKAEVNSRESELEIHQHLQKWITLNAVRISFSGSAFFLALFSLLK